MTRTFDIRELLRVAVRDERGGQEMYRSLSEKATDAELAETFRWLAEQEKGHERRFQAMLDDLGPAPGTSQYPDEYADYLESVAQEGGGANLGARAEQTGSDADAVDLAIRFEREQLALQKDIADVLGDRHREIIDAVLNEERRHLVRLAGAREKLTTG
ncbi:MAG: ferritin family protein [Planctomycetota bacterium]